MVLAWNVWKEESRKIWVAQHYQSRRENNWLLLLIFTRSFQSFFPHFTFVPSMSSLPLTKLGWIHPSSFHTVFVHPAWLRCLDKLFDFMRVPGWQSKASEAELWAFLAVGGSLLVQMKLDTCVMSFRRIDDCQRNTYKLFTAP